MALTFNGSNQNVIITDDSVLSLQSAGTLSIWARDSAPTAAARHYLFQAGAWATGVFSIWHPGTGYAGNPGKYSSILRDGSGHRVDLIANTVVSDALWHHLLYTWNTSTMKLYIDGVVQTSTPSTAAVVFPIDFQVDTYFGSTTAEAEWWPGGIAEAAMWNRELSLDEIHSLRYLPPAALPKDLAWYLPGLADAKEHWAGLTVTDNTDGSVVEHPPTLFRPGPARYVTTPTLVLPRRVFDSPLLYSPVVQA